MTLLPTLIRDIRGVIVTNMCATGITEQCGMYSPDGYTDTHVKVTKLSSSVAVKLYTKLLRRLVVWRGPTNVPPEVIHCSNAYPPSSSEQVSDTSSPIRALSGVAEQEGWYTFNCT